MYPSGIYKSCHSDSNHDATQSRNLGPSTIFCSDICHFPLGEIQTSNIFIKKLTECVDWHIQWYIYPEANL